MQEKFIIKNKHEEYYVSHESPLRGTIVEDKIYNTIEEVIDAVNEVYGKVNVNYSEFYNGCIQIVTNYFEDRPHGIAGVVEYVHLINGDNHCCHMLHKIYVV